MNRIICISLGLSQRNYHITLQIADQQLDIQRIGTDGDKKRVLALLQIHGHTGSILSIDGWQPVLHMGTKHTTYHKPLYDAMHICTSPVYDGSMLRATLERWAIKRAADQVPDIFRKRRILCINGIERYPLAQVLAQYEPTIRFTDPLTHHGTIPFLPTLRSFKHLERYAMVAPTLATYFPNPMPHPGSFAGKNQRVRMEKLFAWADVIVGDVETIRRFAPHNLHKRTLVTDAPYPHEIEDLRMRGVTTLVTMTPPLHSDYPFLTTDVLEAIVAATHMPNGPLDEANVLDFISTHHWEPTIQHLNQRDKPRFAFVIHPLKTSHLFLHPSFRLAKHLPPQLVEWVAAYAPPLYLSRIRGIRSQATGEEVEGLLFSLCSTPREMMRRSPTFTYKRLLTIANRAERRGAKIMGLGAFTSVVGDAGITVAKQSTIGITTGNSLTVAATLEAAKRAALMMGMRTDTGCAVVIGATGSIGAVCARLLALAIGHVVLIAPRPERLLTLKQQIERETPSAQVIAATNPDAYIHNADLIVTTTSTLNSHVLDIEKLKLGAIICDVARPPNVCQAEAERRPDVLVIESGEVRLPGSPDFGFNIDLPSGTAYACMAETALLAMDGRFADYTLGRDIDMQQVKEMYRLMKKHGLELAGLRSFGRYITDEDIEHKRQLAHTMRMHGVPAHVKGTLSEV